MNEARMSRLLDETVQKISWESLQLQMCNSKGNTQTGEVTTKMSLAMFDQHTHLFGLRDKQTTRRTVRLTAGPTETRNLGNLTTTHQKPNKGKWYFCSCSSFHCWKFVQRKSGICEAVGLGVRILLRTRKENTTDFLSLIIHHLCSLEVVLCQCSTLQSLRRVFCAVNGTEPPEHPDGNKESIKSKKLVSFHTAGMILCVIFCKCSYAAWQWSSRVQTNSGHFTAKHRNPRINESSVNSTVVLQQEWNVDSSKCTVTLEPLLGFRLSMCSQRPALKHKRWLWGIASITIPSLGLGNTRGRLRLTKATCVQI